MFKKTDFEKAKNDLNAVEKSIDRLAVRADELDMSILGTRQAVSELNVHISKSMRSEGALADMEQESRSSTDERVRLENWLAQQLSVRQSVALDIAVAKLSIPGIEQRMVEAQAEHYRATCNDATASFWKAIRDRLPALIRAKQELVIVENLLTHSTKFQRPVPKFEAVWNELGTDFGRRAKTPGPDGLQADTDNRGKGEPPLVRVSSDRLSAVERALAPGDSILGTKLTPAEFIEQVKRREDAEKPTPPSPAVCREYISQWSVEVQKLQKEIEGVAEANPSNMSDGWVRDGEDGRPHTAALAAHQRLVYEEKLSGLNFRLRTAREILDRWQASLDLQEPAAA